MVIVNGGNMCRCNLLHLSKYEPSHVLLNLRSFNKRLMFAFEHARLI